MQSTEKINIKIRKGVYSYRKLVKIIYKYSYLLLLLISISSCAYIAWDMPTPLAEFSYSLDNINEAALQLWQQVHPYNILAFNGEMGAGKTTFIHALCAQLGVKDTVSSPTFALVNEYRFEGNGESRIIYHMDWYRLKNDEEAINAGMEDCLLNANENGSYCFIEWPAKALSLLQYPYVWIDITTISEARRSIIAWLKK